MSMDTVRPASSESAAFYGRYIAQVPDGSVLAVLRDGAAETARLLGDLTEENALRRYEPGKWSVKEVLGHVVDVERVFAARALHFARNETQEIPGIEQDDYVAAADFDRRPLSDLVAEFRAVREATVRLFAGFGEGVWSRSGTASGCRFTVRSVAWIIAGHEIHHRRVLRERYLREGPR